MNPYDYHDRVLLLQSQAAQLRESAGVPTFTSTLKITRARMVTSWAMLESLAIAETIFRDWKYPDTRETVIGCLDQFLHTCNALGIPFPAVFLLRRKQLQAGEFVPERRSFPLFEEKKK